MSFKFVSRKAPWRENFDKTRRNRVSSRLKSDQAEYRTNRGETPSSSSRRGIATAVADPDPDPEPDGMSSTTHSTGAIRNQRSRTLLRTSTQILQERIDNYEPEDDLSARNREHEDHMDEIIMAVDIRGRDTVGCSFYNAFEQRIFVLNDVKLGSLDIIQSLKTLIQPTTILLSARIDEKVDDIIDPDRNCRDADSVEGRQYLPYVVEIRSSREFDPEEGRKMLAETDAVLSVETSTMMSVPSDDVAHDSRSAYAGFTDYQNRLLHLATIVDFESVVSIGCAAAVVAHIDRMRAQLFMPGDPNASSVLRTTAIEMFSIHDVMYLGAETLRALQVIESESHPHMQNLGSNSHGSKESLSVFGLFQHLAKTQQGKRKLRQAFLRPSINLDTVNQRHDSLATFLHAANNEPRNAMVKSLKSIRNISPVLLHLRKGVNAGGNGGNAIRNGIRKLEHAENLEIRRRIGDTFEGTKIARIGRDITSTIDFSASIEENRTVIQTGVDEELDTLKRTYAGIDNLLTQLSNEIVLDFGEQEGDFYINVVTYPQIGFLIAVQKDSTSNEFPQPPRTRLHGQPDAAWDRIFKTDEVIYYKDIRMNELDRRYGDIVGHIHDKEIEIIYGLGSRVLADESMLCIMSDVCGDLDVLLALADGALLYNLTRPVMTTENTLKIVGGRHILQEQVSTFFVGNDTHLVGASIPRTESSPASSAQHNVHVHDGPSMMLVTGPNFSGKSVYLKQIALIVLLAHVGCYVPAEEATIGLTDKILTRISTKETVSKQQSTFMIDVQQISTLLKSCTARSLCVIDEFGKGTTAEDGAGLVSAVLKNLLYREDNRPKVVAATHFHEIFENNVLTATPRLSCMHMAIELDENAPFGEQVTHLYRLLPGHCISSFGTDCAAMSGVPSAVIKRALDLMLLQRCGELLPPHNDLTDQEIANLEVVERNARLFLMRQFSQPESENDGGNDLDWLRELCWEVSETEIGDSNDI